MDNKTPKEKAEIKTISDYALILEHCNRYSKTESKKLAAISYGEDLFEKLLSINTQLFKNIKTKTNE